MTDKQPMSDDHAASQRRLLLLASERAVELTRRLLLVTWGRPRLTPKVQGVVAQAWLEGYAQAIDEFKAHMKDTEVKKLGRGK